MQEKAETGRLYRVAEAATLLAVSRTLLYQLIERGELPCYRLGAGRGAIRLSQADLDEFLQRRRQASEPAVRPTRRRAPLKHLKL